MHKLSLVKQLMCPCVSLHYDLLVEGIKRTSNQMLFFLLKMICSRLYTVANTEIEMAPGQEALWIHHLSIQCLCTPVKSFSNLENGYTKLLQHCEEDT
jgi:hypothetical protein